MKRSWLLGVLVGLVLGAFHLSFAMAAPAAPTRIDADDPNIQYVGRFNVSNPKAPVFSWPGVYISAVFDGSSLGIRLKSNQQCYNVIIDDHVTVLNPMSTTDTDYPIAKDLKAGPHTVVIVKRTEGGGTSNVFYGFVLDAGERLLPPPVGPKRKIEFIGDSFSTGYNNQLISLKDPANPLERSNAYLAFGPLTARHFKADYSLIAMSGIGLIGGAFPFHMPDVYQCVTTGDDDNSDVWDFSRWQADVVVVYLGLNDALSAERVKKFEDAYVDFLRTIRSKYAQAEIIVVWNGPGAHLDCASKAIKQIGDKKMHAVNWNVDLSKGGTGPDDGSHPNVVGQRRLADGLVKIINNIVGWDAGAGRTSKP